MHKDIIPISDSFWNVRGSYKIRGLIDVGTQASLVRRKNGKFVFLDSYTLSDSVQREIYALTNGGQDVEAILNVHPFHTIHVESMHRAFPSARLYGTVRHRSRLPNLPWQQPLCEEPALPQLFAEDFDFSVPRGVDFVSADESVHLSSVLVVHRASRTLHVDDTLMYVALPWPLRLLHPVGLVRIHITLPKSLEQRAGAAQDFRRWMEQFADQCREVDTICAAHSAVLRSAKALGTSVPDLLRTALAKAEPLLRAHERKYGG